MAGINCSDTGLNISELLKPLMLKAVFSNEGEVNIDALVNVMIQDKMEQALLNSIQLPQDFADLEDVICVMLQMDKYKALSAALKGEAPPAGSGLDKIINLVVQLQMLQALEGAFNTTTPSATKA